MQNNKIENILLEKLGTYPKMLKHPDLTFNNIQEKLKTNGPGWQTMILLPLAIFTFQAIFIIYLLDNEKTSTHVFKLKSNSAFYGSQTVETLTKKLTYHNITPDNLNLQLLSEGQLDHKNLTQTKTVQIDSTHKTIDQNKSNSEDKNLLNSNSMLPDTTKNNIPTNTTYKMNDPLVLLTKMPAFPVTIIWTDLTIRKPYKTFPFIVHNAHNAQLRKRRNH